MTKPDFIIAGERRSGSTTLYHILDQHPGIGLIGQVDFDFFIEPELFSMTPVEDRVASWESSVDINHYYELFDGLEGVKGQKDADLLWWKPSHARLAKYLPDTRFIVVLREPVARAISQYHNERAKGRETLSIEEALNPVDANRNSPWSRLHLEYVKRGNYAESLKHFYQHIPPKRVLVIILEELFANWEQEINRLCGFLSIDEEKARNLKPVHTNREQVMRRAAFSKTMPLRPFFDLWDRLTEAAIVRVWHVKKDRDLWRSRLRGFYYTSKRDEETLAPELLRTLRAYYRETNRELQELLGKELKYW